MNMQVDSLKTTMSCPFSRATSALISNSLNVSRWNPTPWFIGIYRILPVIFDCRELRIYSLLGPYEFSIFELSGFNLLDGFSVGYGNEKRTASDEAVPLCGIVEDYRTFIEDFKRVLEFVEWLEEESWCKKSTILLDNLKIMVIFAVFSYELGRQVKASIFSLKGMLAFFIIVP